MSSDLVKKNVNYLGRDFSVLRENLKTFVKSYFSENYQDFSESSAGMMLMEIAAYIGDVLGFYMDNQFKELYSDTLTQRKSAINLANMFGYKTKPRIPSTVDLDIYAVVPATGSAGNRIPDYKYCPIISRGARAISDTTPSIVFETLSEVNFAISISGSLDSNGREEVIYEVDDSNIVTKFLLRKRVKAVGGETFTFNQQVNEPQKFLKIQLPSNEVTEIVSVIDSDGNYWYEVENLAQDTIFIEQENNIVNDPLLSSDSGSVPYLLKLKKVPRRFEVKVDENDLTYLVFGSGISNSNDEELIPNPYNVISPLQNEINYLDYAINPEDFLKTKTFGQAPANTILTINYRAGGGIESNVPAQTITKLENVNVNFPISENLLDIKTINDIKSSISCINEYPAMGGADRESVESIKFNAVNNYKSQKRCVTKEDYIVRAYSMPSKFGRLAKVYVDKDVNSSNPFNINMYVLSYDNEKHLSVASYALKNNLRTYLNQYRILTDSISILDGNIINIGIVFEIIVFKNENKNEVLLRCIDALNNYFNIDRWNFNQPIVYSELYRVLMDVKGVQSVPLDFNTATGKRAGVNIFCKTEENYSNVHVDIEGLTRNGIIYPPRDVSIFEIKYPQVDIIGRAL